MPKYTTFTLVTARVGVASMAFIPILLLRVGRYLSSSRFLSVSSGFRTADLLDYL